MSTAARNYNLSTISIAPTGDARAFGDDHVRLFTPLKVGAFDLSHRVVLAPTTRLRIRPPLHSNPDLPYRLRHDLALTPYVRDAFWDGTEKDYSDFAALGPAVAV